MSTIRKTSAIQYVLLPGLKPRIKRLFGTGFVFFSTLMAQIYAMTGLLPQNHPYLNPANAGRFGIRHVIAEAANNLTLDRRNIDKIFIFFALLIGAVILFVQLAIMVGMLLINQAWAAIHIPIGGLFDTLYPQTDIAYNLLTLIFGIPGIYCSSSAPATCNDSDALVPFPIHNGLHDLFQFYSFGLLLIGVLIFLYYVVVVVVETAVTGSPFGRRFQNGWVPIRLVVALGLLVPINYGLNTGQYLALYAAKLGSSIATNGWLRYNNTILDHSLFGGPGTGANPIGEKETLIGVPKRPDMSGIVQAMSLVHTCAYGYWAGETKRPAGHIRNFAQNHYHYANVPHDGTNEDPIKIRAWFVKTSPNEFPAPGPEVRHELLPNTTITEALDFYGNGNILIRFGEYGVGDGEYDSTGGVESFCGDIVIPVVSVQGRDVAIGDDGSSAAMMILDGYFRMVRDMWFRNSDYSPSGLLKRGAVLTFEHKTGQYNRAVRTCDASEACANDTQYGLPRCGEDGAAISPCESQTPSKVWTDYIIRNIHTDVVNPLLIRAWRFYVEHADIEIEEEILRRGWGGAGMWFNRLAHINGSFQDAANAVPMLRQYPKVMEFVRDSVRRENAGITGTEQFSPNLVRGRNAAFDRPGDLNRATAMYETYKLWNDDGGASGDPEKEIVYNIIIDGMNMILGTDALFDIRGANVQTHPLVQLIMIGKSMVESTIRNLAVAGGTAFMGGMMASLTNNANNFFSGISKLMTSTAFLGLTAGVVLFYVLPFLPFVYFFFAIGSWVKTIFEAMVGIPLWALAHLRLDGNGLPGEAASNGYFLILDIGLRPILAVFGLIAAIAIFTAQVRVLNFIWDLVVENAAGFSNDEVAIGLPADYFETDATTDRDGYKRGIIDQFFFTMIYTIIVYMMATASFKLIDSIPDNIMRWGGIGVSAFGDTNQDPLDGLQRYVAMGGIVQGQELTRSSIGALEGTGSGLGRMIFGSNRGGGAGGVP